MSRKRKTYSADFKTKVVLELLNGELTLNQISTKYEITPKSLSDWKKQFLENASLAFDVGVATKGYKQEIDTLKEQNDELAKALGKTTVERDWAVGKLKSLDLSNKRELVQSKLRISMTRQCELLQLNRTSMYYEKKPVSALNVRILNKMDEIYTNIPFYGYRRIHKQLLEEGFQIGEMRVLKYMAILGIQALFPKKKKLTSIKNHEHKVYPYLLKDMDINRPNQVWSGDITYIRTAKGFMYLAAIIDWHTKAILSWKISNTMDSILATCVLRDAISVYGKPDIFNSDQGSQYTSYEHTAVLRNHSIKISMNGKGRSIDNIQIERFFRTLKYENIYISEYQSVKELKVGISNYIHFYNFNRFHSALGYQKPMNVYQNEIKNVA